MNQYQKEMEQLLTLQDKRTNRKIYDLYRDTVRELKKSLEADYQNFEKLSRTERINLNRAEALLESLESRLAGLQEGLNGVIPDHLKTSGKLAYNGLFYEYEQIRSGIAFSMLREDELMTLIETPVAGLRLSDRINDGLVPDLRKNIKDELTRGFLHGDNYAKVSKRLALVGQSSYQRALRIVRTETGRVTATTRQRSQSEAHQLGIELEKMWVATLDKRTRHNHGQLDGQKVGPNDYFEVNGRKALQPHMFGVASEDINCRCRTISVLKGDDNPLLRRDSETGEVIQYKNYREWEASKNRELKQSQSSRLSFEQIVEQAAEEAKIKRKTSLKQGAVASIEKTNMAQAVGLANYNQFLDKFDTIENEQFLELYQKLGHKIEYQKLKGKDNFAKSHIVQLTQSAFDGMTYNGHYWKHPLSTVFHENGHALDTLGLQVLTKGKKVVVGTKEVRMMGQKATVSLYAKHASELPQYNLKETIKKDLWSYINKDLPMLNDPGYKYKRGEKEKIKAIAVENFKTFRSDMERTKEDLPNVVANLSDMVEATGWLGNMPFGWGHNHPDTKRGSKKDYWSNQGATETEFFAEISEMVANDVRGYGVVKKMLPNAVDVYHKIVEDIIKGVD